MPDHAPFLRAIIADPANDEARLRYSDYLVDVGEDERAEFIRCQVELASLRCESPMNRDAVRRQRDNSDDPTTYLCRQLWGGCRHCDLHRRQEALLGEFANKKSNATAWTPHMIWDLQIGRQPRTYPLPTFRRGFIEHITLSWADWLAHEAELRAATPLREVTLTTWPEVEFKQGDRGPTSELVAAGLKVRWKGIKFSLPPVSWRNYTSQYRDIPRDEVIARMHDLMGRGGLTFTPPLTLE